MRVRDWSKFDQFQLATRIQWLQVLYVEPENSHKYLQAMLEHEFSTKKLEMHVYLHLHRLFTGSGCLNARCRGWCQPSLIGDARLSVQYILSF